MDVALLRAFPHMLETDTLNAGEEWAAMTEHSRQPNHQTVASVPFSEWTVKVIVPEKHAAKEEADRIRAGTLLEQLMQQKLLPK